MSNFVFLDLSLADSTRCGFLASVPKPHIIYDALNDVKSSYILRRCTTFSNFLIIDVTYRENGLNSFLLEPSTEDEAKSILATLDHFGWLEAVSYNGSDVKSQLVQSEIQQYYNTKEHVLIGSSTNLDSIVRRIVKPLGLRISLLNLPGVLAKKALQASFDSHIAGEGFGFLLSSQASRFTSEDSELYPILKNGLILVTQAETENTKSDDEYAAKVLGNQISKARNSKSISEYLEQNFVFRSGRWFLRPDFRIFNLQSDHYTEIGKITMTLDSKLVVVLQNDAQILFPGGVLEAPRNTRSRINFSMSRSLFNYGYPPSTSFEVYYQGADQALVEINNNTAILPNHNFERFDYSSGAGYFDYDYAVSQLSQVQLDNNFGFATIAPVTSTSTIGLYNVLQELSVNTLVVGGASLAQSLSLKAEYPNFLRVSVTVYYDILAVISFFKLHNWKRYGIVYQTDAFGIDGYKTWEHLTQDQDFEAMNSKNNHAISFGNKEKSEVATQAADVYKSGARVLFVIGLWTVFTNFFESLYDFGIHKGDVQVVVVGSFEETLLALDSGDAETIHKRQTIGRGAIYLHYQVYSGELGHHLQVDHNAPSTPFYCTYYDATLLIGYGISQMLALGKVYEESQQLRNFVTQTKFTGCSGIVVFEGNQSNNRSPRSYDVENLREKEDGSWNLVCVGKWQPGSSLMWSFDQKIQWNDGSTNIPSDMRIDKTYTCGFDPDDLDFFLEGQLVSAIPSALAILFTLFLTISTRKKWLRVSPTPLQSKMYLSTNDILYYSCELVVFFQLCAFVPTFHQLLANFGSFFSLLILDLDKVMDIGDYKFYFVACSVIIGSIVFVVLAIMMSHNVDLRIETTFGIASLGFYLENSIPVIANVILLPFLNVLTETFQCLKSLNGSFSESYLYVSCEYTCWKTTAHILTTSGAIVSLLLLVLCSIVYKYQWQLYAHDLHVMKSGAQTVFGLCLMVSVVCGLKLLRNLDQLFSSLFVVIMFSGAIAFNLRHCGFNYDRARCAATTKLAALAWISLLSFVNDLRSDTPIDCTVLVISLISGLLLISVIGGFVGARKYPDYLKFRRYPYWSVLFRFAFRLCENSSNLAWSINRINSSYRTAAKDAYGLASGSLGSFEDNEARVLPEIAQIACVDETPNLFLTC